MLSISLFHYIVSSDNPLNNLIKNSIYLVRQMMKNHIKHTMKMGMKVAMVLDQPQYYAVVVHELF